MANENRGDKAKSPEQVVFHIDKKQQKLTPPITGQQLYSVAMLGEGYELYLESKGHADDVPITNNDEVVPLQNGDKVYSAQSTLNPGSH
jgi:hypothetical protein